MTSELSKYLNEQLDVKQRETTKMNLVKNILKKWFLSKNLFV